VFHFLYKYFIKENVKSSQNFCHDEILSASVAIFHSRNVATGQEKFIKKKQSHCFDLDHDATAKRKPRQHADESVACPTKSCSDRSVVGLTKNCSV